MADRIILVIDVETTGLDPSRHEIIDLWAVALDAKDLAVRWQAGGRVMPRHIETASPKALEINRYDAEEWAESWASDLHDVWGNVVKNYTSDTIAHACGHNIQFDVRFLDAGLGVAYKWWNHRLIDTASIAIRDQRAGRFDVRSLSSLVGYYVKSSVALAHWRPEQRHSARADARITAAVLRGQLYQRKPWDKQWEESLWPDEDPAPSIWPRVHYWAAKNRLI